MIEFLFTGEHAAANLPFTVALGILFVLGLLEGISLLMGFGLGSFLDNLLPDMNLDVDLDVDADVDVGDPGLELDTSAPLAQPSAFLRTLNWLGVGQLPVMMLLAIFLGSFGLIGITVQWIFVKTLGWPIPAIVAWLPVLVVSLIAVGYSAHGLARIIPRGAPQSTSSSAKDVLWDRFETQPMWESIVSPAAASIVGRALPRPSVETSIVMLPATRPVSR